MTGRRSIRLDIMGAYASGRLSGPVSARRVAELLDCGPRAAAAALLDLGFTEHRRASGRRTSSGYARAPREYAPPTRWPAQYRIAYDRARGMGQMGRFRSWTG